jgi:hypothetical protein
MLVTSPWLVTGIMRVFQSLAVVVMKPRASRIFRVLKRCLVLRPV